MEASRKKYFENLDALRAIAAFAVIFFHISIWLKFPSNSVAQFIAQLISLNKNGGPMGVEFFFVLSGFLITYLMFLEKEKSGKFNIRLFYIRRILRIWPLYYLTLLIAFLIYPFILAFFSNSDATTHDSSFLLYSVFLANFDNIRVNDYDNGMLGVQWSVAIEEQFYLIWPLIFTITNRTVFLFIAILILFFSLMFFGLNYMNWKMAYYHTASQFRFLSFGGILGLLSFFYSSKIKIFFESLSKSAITLIYLGCIILICTQKDFLGFHPLLSGAVRFVIMLFFGFVILEQNFSDNSFIKLGRFKFLNWLGKISYGLYLLHMVSIYIILHIFNNNENLVLIESLLVIVFTIAISYLSYRYLESYFLGLKRKFSNL